jgi:hypothetical protein
MSDEIDLERILERQHSRLSALMRTPAYGAKILTGRLGIPQSMLTNWLTRKVFDLDADQHRTAAETRLYSARDAIMLAHAARLAAFGLPMSAAKPLAERFAGAVPAYFLPRASTFAGDEMRVFPRGNEWVVARYSHDDSKGKKTFNTETLSTGWAEEISEDQIPRHGLIIEPLRFTIEVLAALGQSIAVGTDEDIRAAVASKTKRKGK